MRSLILTFLIGVLPALAAAAPPISPLNDTGQTQCWDGSAMADCTDSTTGDTATFPGQDGRYGRDAAAETGALKPADGSIASDRKQGGGAAGFDFTPLDVSGNEIPLTGNPPKPASPPRCVRDNITGLIWEVKTDDGGLQDKDWTYTFLNSDGGNTSCRELATCNTDAYVNAVRGRNLCSQGQAWRLPTIAELLSIVHYGANISLTGPTALIDGDYFPNTRVTDREKGAYWSATPFNNGAWLVEFANGDSGEISPQAIGIAARLVSSPL